MKLKAKYTMGVAAACAAFAFTPGASGQSADALLDKLVSKGILTTDEANELKDDADKGFTQAYSIKSGLPDWVTSLSLGGDFRGRFDGIYRGGDSSIDRNRFRYRLRFGAKAILQENFEAGVRLISTPPGGNPISGNQSFDNNGSKKPIAIDLVYAKWNAINQPDYTATFTFGKMENPFVFSDMVFDSDYTPEGAAIQGTYDVGEKHGVSGTVAGFVLEEVGGSSRDSYLLGAQLRLDSSWTEKISSSFGVAGLAIQSPTALTTAAENNINDGNFRTAGGVLVEGFNPIVVDGAVTYKLDSFPGYKGVFPIKLHGDYLNNPRAQELGESYSVGLKLGKAGKKGLWEIGYAWKEHQNNTWYEEMVDSDTGVFYAVAPAALGAGAGYQSGIGYRGNVISAKYNPYDFMQLSLKLMNMAAINENPVGSGSTINRILLDVIWKF